MSIPSFSEADAASRAPRSTPAITKNFAKALRKTGTKFQQQARQRIYYNHPDIWAKEVLGFEAWSKQREIGDSIVENSYTAVKSCHGAGKSAWAAVIVCWFVATRLAAGEEVFVITTAPSYSQVHLVLWEEIRKHHAKGNLPGYVTNGDEWKMEVRGRAPIELAKGRKPSDTDANSFQGKHAYNLLIVLDEANGIPELLYTGATVMLTGDMSRQKMLAIGNPDDPNSKFGQEDAKDKKRIARGEKPFWNTIQIKAWDTPNFTDEHKQISEKVRHSVLSKDWVERARGMWDEEDPRWISKIEAEFPTVSAHSLFSRALIDQSAAETVDPGWELPVSRALGCDIARFGDDRTVIMLNIEGDVVLIDSWAKKDTLESANRIHNIALEHHVTQVRVDVGAMGAGVIDNLRAMCGMNYMVISMDGSASSPDIKRWINARDYWYDNLREQMFLNKVKIPVHERLHEELAIMEYAFQKGALKVEPKADIKKRLKRSPDFADALVYATADLSSLIDPEQPKPQAGDTGIIDIGFQQMMAREFGGFTVSPV